MLLAIDIGNTNITLGVFDNERLAATWRLSTDRSKMPDEYSIMLTQLLQLQGLTAGDISDVALCSVVPPLTPVFVELCRRFFNAEPLVVAAGTRTGIRILYDNPRDVGADRIVDAAAAMKLYGGPVIVVDIGTATVFDAVTADGDYLGGAIAPGMAIAADALFSSTSQLRRVELVSPETPIGRNTVHAIQSGIVLGYADLVRGMVARFDRELGGGSKVVATGGLAHIIEKEARVFDDVNPDLTLTGLRLIHEMASSS
jgi:type III pantothenate kinase